MPATDGSRKTWAHRGETVENCFIIGANNERTVHNAPTVLRRKKFIVLAAVKPSEKNLSCKQIQNQLAKKSRTGSRRCYALQKTLLYAVRFLRSDENIIFAAVMPSVRMFIAQAKRAL